jgi:transposase
MTILVDDLVPDELWALVEPLLLAPPRPPYGGRHRTISDRACLAAIVYMARTSTPWRLLPARELGCGSPTTCWRRLTEWPTPASSIGSTCRSPSAGTRRSRKWTYDRLPNARLLSTT